MTLEFRFRLLPCLFMFSATEVTLLLRIRCHTLIALQDALPGQGIDRYLNLNYGKLLTIADPAAVRNKRLNTSL